MCKKRDFLKEVELLLSSQEQNNSDYWQKYYSNKTINYFYEDIVTVINEVKRLLKENNQFKRKLEYYQQNYGTKKNMMKLDKKKLVDMLVASWSRENKLVHDWNNFEDWLENLWNKTQDVWYVKIINKIREIRGEDTYVK